MRTRSVDVLRQAPVTGGTGPVRAVQAHLVNAPEVGPDDPVGHSMVAFINDNADGDGWDPSFCSATLIAKDLAVPAAHCIKPERRDKWRLVFSRDARDKSAPWVKVKDFEVNPDYRDGYSGKNPVPKDNSDIALIYFRGGLPSGYAPMEVAPATHALRENDPVWVAGFGLFKEPDPSHPYDPWDWGVLRRAQFKLGDPRYAKTEVKVIESPTLYGAKGDSGGAAYYLDPQSGAPRLLGVTNWGEKDPPFEVFAMPAKHGAWLAEAAARLRSRNPSP